ncbi:MAG: hypothetical protein LBH07_05015 [Treponema sp.]|jgi:hypothetical protein|nr:hypothetical protein [Treponema sp.]
MANKELVDVIDYILNRCDEKSIDAVAAAVVRRRKELTMFGGNFPDPKEMAKEISGQINPGASLEGMRETVRNMAVRIIRQEAPELNDKQIAELTAAWIPDRSEGTIPSNVLLEMIDQFVRYSSGRMQKADDNKLRAELGDWPQRYWKVFPEIVKIIIKEYLNGEIDKKAYLSKIAAALSIEG